MKWAIELSQYDLLYQPKIAIKAEALADFVVEFTLTAEKEKMVTKSKEKADDTSPTDSNLPKRHVVVACRRSIKSQRSGSRSRHNHPRWNLVGTRLRLAKELSIKRFAIYSDSQLITNQASGEYMAKHPRMVQYLDKVQGLLKEFLIFTIQQVLRAENTYADALASLGSALDTQFRCSIPVEHLDRPSIEDIKPINLMQINEDPS
ncbi:unnamed protein product [Prunus armeniaca]